MSLFMSCVNRELSRVLGANGRKFERRRRHRPQLPLSLFLSLSPSLIIRRDTEASSPTTDNNHRNQVHHRTTTTTRKISFIGRNAPATPPDKGSFPLDHEGECKPEMTVFMACLKANANHNEFCRAESMKYLKCRMDRGLMAEEKLEALGFAQTPGNEKTDGDAKKRTVSEEPRKERAGYIAGMNTKPVEPKS